MDKQSFGVFYEVLRYLKNVKKFYRKSRPIQKKFYLWIIIQLFLYIIRKIVSPRFIFLTKIPNAGVFIINLIIM